MHKLPLIIVILTLAGAMASPAAAEDRFFLRIGAGASDVSLKNLDAELQLQGNAKVAAGYSFAVSLGRTFAEDYWSLEAHFAAMFFPGFDYTCPSDSFPGKMRHFSYALVLQRHFRPEGKYFKPTLGAGIGYGVTNLISGGGKLNAPEALITGRVESSITSTIDLSLECTYYAGLQTKQFSSPHLENYEGDAVYDSAGNILSDRYRSLDLRLGIRVWLRQMGPQ
ncbi:MAG: outer membrane beta-barrel protein [Candidatus Krumholzibacteria bacterium]|nr:outer membrane beta-barrel protein [Candidatus Krumholzibacteria bacterium]